MLEEVAQGECESGVSGRSGGSKEGSIKRSVSGGSTERAERVEQAEKRREREESGDKTGSAGRAELERGWTVRRLRRGGESSGGVESGDGGEDGVSAVTV